VNTESAELEKEGEEGGNIESRVYLQVPIASTTNSHTFCTQRICIEQRWRDLLTRNRSCFNRTFCVFCKKIPKNFYKLLVQNTVGSWESQWQGFKNVSYCYFK
jgi:hypothetical protein